MTRRIHPFVLAVCLAAGACSGNDEMDLPTDPRPVQGVAGDPAQQRAVWEAKAIDDYRFAYSRVCFCMQRGTLRVTVRDGRVTDVRQVKTGLQVPREIWREFLTVDDLFRAIAQAQERGQYTAVTFHPTLGYPVEAELGMLADDSGVRHLLSGLTRID